MIKKIEINYENIVIKLLKNDYVVVRKTCPLYCLKFKCQTRTLQNLK
jgi:hypothetical protein